MTSQLFNILNLLADFFELGFGIHDELGEGGVVGFGPDRIKLPIELLAEEVKWTSYRFIEGEVFAEFFKVGTESGNLLGDITLIGEETNFLHHSVVIEINLKAGLC